MAQIPNNMEIRTNEKGIPIAIIVNFTQEDINHFIDKYLKENNIQKIIHAHWENSHWYNSISCADCSNCKKTSYHKDFHGVQFNYLICPYCGAIMNEEVSNGQIY